MPNRPHSLFTLKLVALLVSICSFHNLVQAAKPGDFTGDGVSDLALYNPQDGYWYVKTTESVANGTCPPCFTYYGYGGCRAYWGWPGSTPRPADYDNDNRVDMAVWISGQKQWKIKLSNPNYGIGGNCGEAHIQFGAEVDFNDRPDAADVTGDGFADVMFLRRNNGAEKWLVRNGANGVVTSFNAARFPGATFTPFATVSADYLPDASGVKAEGVRFENIPTNKLWTVTHFINYPAPPGQSSFASNSHNPFAPADPDEVGTRGQWGGAPANLYDYVRFHKNGAWTIQYTQFGPPSVIAFGLLGDKPLSGDFDGDGVFDPAVWRPTTGEFFVKMTGVCPSGMTHNLSPDYCSTQWGGSLMIPIEALVDMSINY